VVGLAGGVVWVVLWLGWWLLVGWCCGLAGGCWLAGGLVLACPGWLAGWLAGWFGCRPVPVLDAASSPAAASTFRRSGRASPKLLQPKHAAALLLTFSLDVPEPPSGFLAVIAGDALPKDGREVSIS
jgi:hypothetical protein